MIPEEYVTFETARLLKKAGFPQFPIIPETIETMGVPCVKYYRKDGLLTDWIYRRGVKKAVSAPTQSQAMRWLREKDLVVLIDIEYYLHRVKDGYYRFNVYADGDGRIRQSRYIYTTYDAVTEAGIQAACRYLIEKEDDK